MGQLPLPPFPASSSPTSNAQRAVTRMKAPSATQASARQASPKQSSPQQSSDNLALLEVLRQALASGTQSGNSILQATTDAARALTSAGGVAIALRTKAEIICRARSGEIAPELGSPLNVHSGISGECLRSATVLVCSDAETDPRVDPVVCRALGIRSMVMVPLRGQMGIAGVMSAFSTRPSAFGSAHIDLIRALAEIAEVIYERERRVQDKNFTPTTTKRYLGVGGAQAEATDTRSRMAGANAIRFPKVSRWMLGTSLIVLALIAISAAAWWSWHEPVASDNSAASSASQSVITSAHASTDLPSTVEPKPNAAVSARRSDRTSYGHLPSEGLKENGALKNAAEVRSLNAPPTNNAPSILRPTVGSGVPRPAVPENESIDAPPAPVTGGASAESDGIVRLMMERAKLPSLGTAVSQGATEARLIHSVTPTYPDQARNHHIAGSVILDATIAVDGSIRDVKVVSGEFPLTDAATSAIRQWRYSPELLNGAPVEVQKQITIVFKLPADQSK